MFDAWKAWEGQVVDAKFPLLRYLGGSEGSSVFLTERHADERLVKAAIKVVPSPPENRELQLLRWQQAAKLSHPHLIPLYEIGRFNITDFPIVYIVMECADENLAQVLAGRALTPAEAGSMLESIVDVLSYLHGKGFVHGHIKPANIMASGDQLKLSSEGLHRAGQSLNGLTYQDAYDAPENARSIHSVTQTISPAGDVWSLGMTLVETLTQNLPLPRTRERRDPLLPETLPEPFLDIARHCLLRDPLSRWTVAQIAARLHGPSSIPYVRPIPPAVQTPVPTPQPSGRFESPLPEPQIRTAPPETRAPLPPPQHVATLESPAHPPQNRSGPPETPAAVPPPQYLPALESPAPTPQNRTAPPETRAPLPPSQHIGGLESPAPESPVRIAPPEVHTPIRAPKPNAWESWPLAFRHRFTLAKLQSYGVPVALGCALALAVILAVPRLLYRHSGAQQAPAATRQQPLVPPAPRQAPQSPQERPANANGAKIADEKPRSKALVPMPALIHPETAREEPTNTFAKLSPSPLVHGEVANRVMPEVPEPARKSIRGTVRVSIKVDVDRSGNVEDAELGSGGPSKYFAQAALEAARNWKFKPPRIGATGVLSTWTLRFAFTSGETTAVAMQEMP